MHDLFPQKVPNRNKFPLPSEGATEDFASVSRLGVTTSFIFCISSN